MKRTTRLFFTSILLAVFILSACAPASSTPSAEVVPSTTAPTEGQAATVPAATLPEASAEPSQSVQPEATLAPTEAPVQFVPTSRGPDLHATDPTTVSLASGGLQLVEFFRFT